MISGICTSRPLRESHMRCHRLEHGRRSKKYLLAVVALIVGSLPVATSLHAAASDVTSGTCVQANGGNSCTANDVTFIAVGLGTVTDLCLTPAGTMTLFMGATLNNTTAQN